MPDRSLSPAQLRVCEELTNTSFSLKEIAHRLNVTPSTVDAHCQRIYRKLGVRTRVELIQKLRGGVQIQVVSVSNADLLQAANEKLDRIEAMIESLMEQLKHP